jgi:hypothetical protein
LDQDLRFRGQVGVGRVKVEPAIRGEVRAMRRLPLALCAGLTMLATSVGTTADAAVLLAPPGSVGFDVSYPQCASTPPTGGAFGIVGLTDGLAFSANPCLSRQYAALSTTGYPTGLYVNTGNPGPSSSHWPTSPTTTPAKCVTPTDPDDPGCAYDYGWAAAANAVATAQAAGVTVSGRTWWLDVEQDNSWAPNTGAAATAADHQANAADLQGEMDGLYANEVTQVGIYSTDLQWQEITGGLTTTTQSAYVAAWSSYLTPTHALSAAPLWIAGAAGEAGAYTNCSQTFTGAAAALAQYSDAAATDADLVCGEAPVAPPATVPGAPRDPVAKPAKTHGVTLSWAAPAGNGGAVVAGYRIYRGTVGGRLSYYRAVSCTTTECSWTDTSAQHDKRYYYRLAAVNAVGTGQTSTWVTAEGH